MIFAQIKFTDSQTNILRMHKRLQSLVALKLYITMAWLHFALQLSFQLHTTPESET